MAYTLFAVLAPSHVLEEDPPWIADSKIVSLEQGLCMVPVTHALYDGLTQRHTPKADEDWAGFVLSPAPLVGPLERLSEWGTAAYVEADFFGGAGDQRCVVWRKGAVVLGPLDEQQAINRALRRMGFRKQTVRDEFEAVGLNRYRSNEEWLENATDADIRNYQ